MGVWTFNFLFCGLKKEDSDRPGGVSVWEVARHGLGVFGWVFLAFWGRGGRSFRNFYFAGVFRDRPKLHDGSKPTELENNQANLQGKPTHTKRSPNVLAAECTMRPRIARWVKTHQVGKQPGELAGKASTHQRFQKELATNCTMHPRIARCAKTEETPQFVPHVFT